MDNSFDHNDREAILAALDDPDPDNTIAQAIAVRLDAMASVLVEVAQREGNLPERIEISKPVTVLDEIAIELFRGTLTDNPDAPRVIVLDHGRQ